MFLKILFVGPLPPFPGGAAILNSQLLCGLARRGHRVRCISAVTPETMGGAQAFARAHPELRIRRTVQPYYAIGGAVPSNDSLRDETEQLAAALSDELSHYKPEVALFGREPLVPCARQILRESGIPHVAIMHGSIARATLNNELPGPIGAGVTEFLRGSACAVAVAANGAEVAKALGIRNHAVIPNVVDTDAFRPMPRNPGLGRAWRIADDDVVVAHFSNLKPVKRPLDLVHSARRALVENPRLLFLVVGDGPLRVAMQEACAAQAIAARFRFVGWLDHSLIPSAMSVADMVAMPSDAESRSLACLEAQACGRVLIASDIPASRETVRHGSTGFLFEKGDVDALARQMVVIAADADLRARIGGQARAHAERSSLEGFLDAYERVLRAARARSRAQDGGRVLLPTPTPRPARLPSDQRGRAT